MEKPEELTRRNFIKDAGIVAGCAALGSAALLSGCGKAAYECPYCSSSTTFNSKDDLKKHIYQMHAFNLAGNVRHPTPFCITIGGVVPVGEKTATDAHKEFLYEIEKRGWPPCSLEMPSAGVLDDSYITELGSKGYELALDMGDLGALDDQGVSYKDQLAAMKDKLDVLEDAAGCKVLNGRRSASVRNTYTYPICEELGITMFHLGCISSDMPFQETAPYKHPDHDVVIIPRPPLHLYNRFGDFVGMSPPEPAVDCGDYF